MKEKNSFFNLLRQHENLSKKQVKTQRVFTVFVILLLIGGLLVATNISKLLGTIMVLIAVVMNLLPYYGEKD